MLSITPVSAGAAGVAYLTGGGGCEQPHEQGRNSTDYYLADGQPVGVWLGEGVGELGAQAGAPVSVDDVHAIFGALTDPRTGESIGRPPRRFRSAEERLAAALEREPDAGPERVQELSWQIRASARQAVGYYDLTFSPAKSVSVYHDALMATGRTDEAEIVVAAHQEAVAAAMSYVEREAGWSRAGYHGRTRDGRSVGEYVAARRLVSVRFDHSTNRELEPQLHSHVAVLNRVRCEDDGEWRALDGRQLYKERAAAAAIYERTLQERVAERLPVRFELRPDGKAYEIVGIPQELLEANSSRRAQVQAATDRAVEEYRARHGRDPDAYTLHLLAQDASLGTRREKLQDTRSPEERAAAAVDRAGSVGVDLGDVLADVAELARESAPRLDAVDVPVVLDAAVEDVQSRRSTWSRADLVFAIQQQLPSRVGLWGEGFERYVEDLADQALAPGNGRGVVLLTAPDVVAVPEVYLRAQDGRSRWRPHRDERYATTAQLSVEERLAAGAAQLGAPKLHGEQLAAVEADLVARGLGADQREAILGVLGSGRRGDVIVGAAGAGKSRAMAALSTHWQQAFDAPVLGLATSQIAAQVLTGEGLAAVNVARFLIEYGQPVENGPTRPGLEPLHGPEGPVGTAVADGASGQRLPAGTLLVIDESGMSSTAQLDAVRQIAERDGAKLLWTGDPAQLDAVGAGGGLGLLSERLGAYVLGSDATAVRRFKAGWEREASLQLRAGDLQALRAYDDHGRLVEGTKEAVLAGARRAFLADFLAGRSTVLTVATNQAAAEVSSSVREQLVALGRVEPDGVPLRAGTVAGVGDLIQTRRNDTSLRHEPSGYWVVNRDVWVVLERHSDGALTAALEADRHVQVRLPREYVREHVDLAYAGTVHAVQGRTVDTGHQVVDVSTSREALYVGMTRGRDRNTAYVVTSEPRSDDNVNGLQSDRVAVLASVLERETGQRAAVQVMREELEAATSMATLGAVWMGVTAEHARDRYCDALLPVLGSGRLEDMLAEPAVDRLWRAAREADLAGHDGSELLARVARLRELHSADSVADVLRFRLRSEVDKAGTAAAHTWVDRTPSGEGIASRFAQELAAAMDARQRELGELTADAAPRWAVAALGSVPTDPLERQSWTERAAVAAGYRELVGHHDDAVALGPAPSRETPEHRAAWAAAHQALGAPADARDVYAATPQQLRAWVTQGERAERWAPAYVAEQLRDTELRRQDLRAEAVLAGEEARAAREAGDDVAAAAAAGRQQKAQALASGLDGEVQALETVHRARAEWHRHTADDRELAAVAVAELRRRGLLETHRAASEEMADGAAPATIDAALGARTMVDTAEDQGVARPVRRPGAPTDTDPRGRSGGRGDGQQAMGDNPTRRRLSTRDDLDAALTRARAALARVADESPEGDERPVRDSARPGRAQREGQPPQPPPPSAAAPPPAQGPRRPKRGR